MHTSHYKRLCLTELFLLSLPLYIWNLIFSQRLKGAPNADWKSSFSMLVSPLWYPSLQILATHLFPNLTTASSTQPDYILFWAPSFHTTVWEVPPGRNVGQSRSSTCGLVINYCFSAPNPSNDTRALTDIPSVFSSLKDQSPVLSAVLFLKVLLNIFSSLVL